MKKKIAAIAIPAAKVKKILPRKIAHNLTEWLHAINFLGDCQERNSAMVGWWLKEYATDAFGVPVVVACVECGIEGGHFSRGDEPVYFRLNKKTGDYEEVPELYESLWRRPSQKIGEMSENPLRDRLKQFNKEKARKLK